MEASASDLVTPARLYEVLQGSIKQTDEISFKLLGFVPLVNGGALFAAVLGSSATLRPPAPAIVVLSLFGALVTLGLFWWELRNIQNCIRYIRIAEALEASSLAHTGIPEHIQRRPPASGGLGKRRGEKLIYSTVVFSWLVLPMMLLERKALPDSAWAFYGFIVLAGAAGTIWAIIADLDPQRAR